MKPSEMTIIDLRLAGYAVAIFSPEELRDAPQANVELAMVDGGFNAIDALGRNEEED